MTSVEIVVGDEWKHDVRYLSDLSPYRPANTSLNLVEIYDIIDVVIDGMNVTSCIPEESVFGFVAWLMEALNRLASGESHKAIIEFQREPWELVLVADGSELLVSLYSIDRERRVVAHDVRTDAAQFVAAVADAAETLLSDLLRISESFSSDAFVRRFSARLAGLKRMKKPRFAERSEIEEARGMQTGSTSAASGLTMTYTLDADDAALRGYTGEHAFDQHALLFAGSVVVESRDVSLQIGAGYPFLTIQSMVRRVRELLNVLESSATDFACESPLHHVRFDVFGGHPHWTLIVGNPQDEYQNLEVEAPPFECLDAALSLAELAMGELLAINPRLELNQRFVDLRDEVEDLRSWFGDFSDTNVYFERPEEYLEEYGDVKPADEVDATPHFSWPLEGVSALFSQRRWRFEDEQIHFSSATCTGDRLLVPTSTGIHCLDTVSGEEDWALGSDEGIKLSSYAMAGDLVAIGDESGAVRAVDLQTGDEIAVVREPDTGSLLLEAAHFRDEEVMVVADFHGRVSGISLTSGESVWNIDPGHGYLTGAGFEGPLVSVLSSPGFLQALNPLSGEVLWKVRLGGVADSGPIHHQGRIYTITHDPTTRFLTVHAFFPFTGRTAWQIRLEGWLSGQPSFLGEWMLLPLELNGHSILTGIPMEAFEPSPAWKLELPSAGVDRPTRVLPVEVDGHRCGIVRTDRGILTCFEVSSGEVVWQTRPERPSDLLFRNLDLIPIEEAVLSVAETLEFRAHDDGRLLHAMADVLVSPEFAAAHGSLTVVVGEAGAGEEPDVMTGFDLGHFLALVD